MISRKSTILLAEAFHSIYVSFSRSSSTSYKGVFNREALYDYLYIREYEAYFLNLIKTLAKYDHSRELKEFIMKLHTGESLLLVTKDWTWEQRKMLGQRYAKDLSRDLMRSYLDKKINTFNTGTVDIVSKLKNQLELDGYIFEKGELLQIESSVINEQNEQNYLLSLMNRLSLEDVSTIKHHISLAEEHFINSKWDDSIGNSRKFLEAIFQQIALLINKLKYSTELSDNIKERPAEIRNYLENEGLLEKKEREAFAKIYGLLSETGSHPYMAHKDQARLMWHLALTISQFVLLRFESISKEVTNLRLSP